MKKKPVRKTIALPVGRISYPFLAAPDTGREYSDGAYKVDFLIPLESFKKAQEQIEGVLLEVWRDFIGDPKVKFKDIKKQPLKDLSNDPKVAPNMKDYMLIRAKNKNGQPLIVDINKKEMSEDAIKKLKGGDWCEIIVSFYPYSQSGSGVAAGQDIVRFVKPGEPFGSGAAKHLGLLDDIEITAESFTDDEMASLVK